MNALPLRLEAFADYAFLQRAALAGALLALVCGLLSPLLVLRRLSFAADGLAHAALGGLAAGMFLFDAGAAPSLAAYGVAFLVACLTAAGVAWLAASPRLAGDTVVGAGYVAALALGLLLLGWRGRGTGHLEHYFVGSLLAATPVECSWLAVLALVVAGTLFATWGWLERWIFDDELARVEGVPAGALRLGLMLATAAVVVVAVRVVGMLLVAALLILPGATAAGCARRFGGLIAVSLLVAGLSVGGGLVTSNAVDVAPGPAMALVAFGCFLALHVWRRLADGRPRGRAWLSLSHEDR